MDMQNKAVARYVTAIEAIMAKDCLALIMREYDGEIVLVTPLHIAEDVIDDMARLDWQRLKREHGARH